MTSTQFDHLELTGTEWRALLDRAAARIATHVDSLADQPAHDVDGAAELSRSLIEPVPEAGTDADALLDLLFERAVPKSFNTAGPGYLAYIPGGGVLHAAVGDLIAAAVNRYSGVWLPAPALVQLESNVVRWFAEIVGYPREARGVLTTGGSLANLSAIITARREKLPDEFLGGTIYVSDQVHHSVQKAAVLAGFPPDRVRIVPTDDRFRLRADDLEAAIAQDRTAGRTPFLVVGSGGTVNTGAVDDLDALATICDRHGLWFHVDGAYGGFFQLTERGRAALRGVERSDSVTLDPHKGLFMPYGVGSLLVRDGEALRRAHTVRAAYMPEMQQDPDFWDFCELSPELSRNYRGLGVWLPLKLIGLAPFRRALDEKLDLARWAAARLDEIDGIEIVAQPQLSIVAFRLTRAGLDEEALNALNRELLRTINARRRVYLTATTLRGRFVIRICVLSFRTHRARMEMAMEDIREAVRGVSGS
ncbi:MAG: aminotransferase class I/II-fold pyridoxal phosphate-dependent enzyme, partial [Gemmatimonadales bacterium]|jgi:aromatic-L-amino-acid decarboxylase